MATATQPVKHSELSQRVVRKDGVVEEIGIVAYWDERWQCRAIFRVEYAVRRLWLRIERARRWCERTL